jgi:hypothetical protein
MPCWPAKDDINRYHDPKLLCYEMYRSGIVTDLKKLANTATIITAYVLLILVQFLTVHVYPLDPLNLQGELYEYERLSCLTV